MRETNRQNPERERDRQIDRTERERSEKIVEEWYLSLYICVCLERKRYKSRDRYKDREERREGE